MAASGVGQKLPSETELARTLGVSRPAVREALGGLRAMGLVESIDGRGTYVNASAPSSRGPSLLDRYSTDKLHEVRSHVEIPGARLAARRRGPEQIARRRSIVESRVGSDPIEDGPRAEEAMAAHLGKIRELSRRAGTGPVAVRGEPEPAPRRRT